MQSTAEQQEVRDPGYELFCEMLAFEKHAFNATIYVDEQDKTLPSGKTLRTVKYRVPRRIDENTGKIEYVNIEHSIWTTDFHGNPDIKAQQLVQTLRAYDGHTVVVYLGQDDFSAREWTSKTGKEGVTGQVKNAFSIPTFTTVLQVQQEEQERLEQEANAPAFDAPPSGVDSDEDEHPF